MPCPPDFSRVDRYGRAYKGSQRQIQSYVNLRPVELTKEVVAKLQPRPAHGASISWVSPLASQRYAEYRDSEFLEVVNLGAHFGALRSFWPARGPCWDALAIVKGDSDHGVVLVEAKSYVDELYGSGTGAKGESLRRIRSSLEKTKQWLGVSDACDWTGSLYQTANRLAHLYFLRQIVGIPAWLVNVYFLNDRIRPTSKSVWSVGLRRVKDELGLNLERIDYVAEVFLGTSDAY